jgi:predicted ATPase
MSWRIDLLGDIRVTVGGSVIRHFESRKVAALLARLALYPRRVHTREELAALLWPDADEATGRRRLRHALSSLRRHLAVGTDAAAEPFVADSRTIRVSPGAFVCDVAAFEAAVRAGDGAAARALYTGDLLPGFYEDWIGDERERLAALRDALPEGSEEGALAATESEPALVRASVFLPNFLTAFFGREHERTTLAALLTDRRLVTVQGPGGSGKTRLSIETSRELIGRFETIAFVPLAECVSADQLPDRVRSALQLPAGDVPPLEQLLQAVGSRPLLLILDNVEQLVESGAPEIIEDLLMRLPGLHCLVTSRRLLGIAGEQLFPLAPLPLPDPALPLDAAARVPSVALFVDRARASRPDFTVTPRNQALLVGLCRELEGMPLALELAASRIRTLSLTEMHEQLRQRFQLLARPWAGGRKDLRHQSLYGALAWSWRLLPPHQQDFLAALSVFRGGWTAPLAADVCEASDAADLLSALTADSLVVPHDAADGGTRFSMLETIREYAAERLPDDRARALRARHRACFTALARSAPREGAALRADADNFEAAILSAPVDGVPAEAIVLALALRPLWDTLGIAPEVLDTLRRLVDAAAPDGFPTVPLAAASAFLAEQLLRAGDGLAAETYAERAVRAAGADSTRRAPALAILSSVLWRRQLCAAAIRPRLDEALALARSSGDEATQARVLALQGILAMRCDQAPLRADTLFQEAQRLYERQGAASRARHLLQNRIIAHQLAGRPEEAAQLIDRYERLSREAGDHLGLAQALGARADAHMEAERWNEAIEALREGIQASWRHHQWRQLAFALWNLPEPLVHAGKPEGAARLMGFIAQEWEARIGGLSDDDRAHVSRVRAHVAAVCGAARTGTFWREGEALSLADAVALALDITR